MVVPESSISDKEGYWRDIIETTAFCDWAFSIKSSFKGAETWQV
jgi:hypothetical protein